MCALVCLCGVPFRGAVANDGGATHVGSGGDAYATEFVGLGRTVAKMLRDGRIGFRGVNSGLFTQHVEMTQVATRDRTVIGNHEVDAINYPDRNVIELNRERWASYRGDTNRKLALVLHEYLGVMGLQERNYEKSSIYFQFLNDPFQTGMEQLRVTQGVVLNALSETCAETWCEGMFYSDFTWSKIACDEALKTCSINFEMRNESRGNVISVNADVTGEGFAGGVQTVRKAKVREFEVSCRLNGFSNLNELVRVSPSGKVELSDSFDVAMTRCMNGLENKISKLWLGFLSDTEVRDPH